MAHDTQREHDIFLEALELTSAQERRAFLQEACGHDETLRQAVQSLLEAHAEAEGFIPTRLAASAQDTAPAPETDGPGTRIGRYKLLQKIGEGGCGIVYMADQEEPVRRRVALKVIKLGMDTRQVIARFEAERQALALMDHPNIAKVQDAGATETGRPYFVMELVRGVKITEYCDQKNLSTSERLKLFTQVCQAVQHAHQKGIVHRDIKPSNILVTVNDGVPLPKVIDFGIAKATAGQQLTDRTLFTAFEQFIGTPAYMSPEQAEMTSVDIDTRSDIYSLGVLLYELLTGQTPFDAKELLSQGLDAMRKTIREQEPVRPSTKLRQTQLAERSAGSHSKIANRKSQIANDLDWIVMKCLEKDRTRRYETANGLASDLQRHLSQEPVLARPPSALYRFQKLVQRNRLAVGSAGVVLLSLVLGIAATTWQAVRATSLGNQATADERMARTAQLRAELSDRESRHLLYVARMNLVQASWEENNIGRMRQLLSATATDPDRGFEWYYWERQTHLEFKDFLGHSAAICGVAFSPDGRRMVTASWDQTAKVWDVTSGQPLLTLRGHGSNVNAVAFSPKGNRIVTGCDDGTVKMWHAQTGTPLLTIPAHSNAVYAVAFSTDGQRLVTCSADQTAKIWDTQTGIALLTLRGHTEAVRSVVFSPDGRRIVTGTGRFWGTAGMESKDHTAKMWDAVSGSLLLKLEGHSASVWAVAFSPDGQRVLTGSSDHTAKIWDAASGNELLTLRDGHSAPIRCVAISPDGKRIVTGSADQTARVWDPVTGKERLVLKGHSALINSVAFSPDGERIVTASGDWMSTADHTVKLWNVNSNEQVRTIRVHGPTDGPYVSVAFAPDGQRIVTGIGNGTAKVWNISDGGELLTLNGHRDGVAAVAFAPDGQRIVTGSSDGTAKVWETTSGQELLTLEGHQDEIYSVSFSSDGQRIVTGSWDGTAKVWDAVSSSNLFTLQGHIGRIWSAAISPDGHQIVAVGDDPTGKVWDAATGKELLTLNGHSRNIVSVVFSHDGRRILTGSSDRTAKVWDASTGRELLTLVGHSDQVWAAAFSPDGRRIVTGCPDGLIKLWDSTSGEELLTLKGHTAQVRCVVFSPDGQRILSSGYDDTARIWTAASPQQVSGWQKEQDDAPRSSPGLGQDASAEEPPLRGKKSTFEVRDLGAIQNWLTKTNFGQPMRSTSESLSR